jgi:DNA-binding XRE family transcriptional regulator
VADGSAKLRSHRRAVGLTQAELARRAGVSRQLVAAVEAGRNVPAVDAAIRLARALDTGVEELFAAPAAAPVLAAVGERLPAGVPLRIGRVGERLVAAPLPDHGTAGGGWAPGDGVLEDGGLRLFAGAGADGLVLAGCDPALGIAEAFLRGPGSEALVALSAPTGAALDALRAGRVHAAVVHGPPRRLPRPPVPVRRIHLASWPVGLGVPAGQAGGLAGLLDAGTPVVQREPAAASQQALIRAVRRLHRPLPAGPRAGGHIEAARRGAALGVAALTTEAAARAFGLRFAALEEHTVEVWIAEPWAGHRGVRALGEVLSSRAFTERVGCLGGYDLTGCGAAVG